jgi:hypothetical protein
MRRRNGRSISFSQRLANETERFRKAAEELLPGTARELLMKRVRHEAALDINDGWPRQTQPRHLRLGN